MSICSAGDSRVRTSRSPTTAGAGSMESAPGSGESSPGSSGSAFLAGSSSRTSTTGGGGGCPLCGATWPASGTGPSRCECEPITVVCPIGGHAVSSSRLLPTLTRRDSRTLSGAQCLPRRGSLGLAQTVRERLGLRRGATAWLRPSWCETHMGFPVGWSDPETKSESLRSETPWFQPAPKSLGG